MKRSRFLLAAVLLLPACGTEETVVQVLNPAIASPSNDPAADPVADERAGDAALGADGEPRLVFVSAQDGKSRVRLVRRRSDALWSVPLDLSAAGPDAKTGLRLLLSPSNDLAHVLWLEAGALHYVRVRTSGLPVIEKADAVVSSVPPAGASPGALLGDVTAFDAAVSATTGDLALIWLQAVDDDGAGPGSPDVVPIAARVALGVGEAGERVALTEPNQDATAAFAMAPRILFSPAGDIHALWGGSEANGSARDVRHRLRTDVATWSDGPSGDRISDRSATGEVVPLACRFAADGDLYVATGSREGGNFHGTATYRPAGAATTFVARLGTAGGAASGVFQMAAEISPAADAALIVFTGAGLPLNYAWMGNVTLGTNSIQFPAGVTGIPGVPAAGTLSAWLDASGDFAFAYQTDAGITRVVSGAPVNLMDVEDSAAGAQLAVGLGPDGRALLAWRQGDPAASPDSALLRARRPSGGPLSPVAAIASGRHAQGPFLARVAADGVEHVFWHAADGTAGPFDILHAIVP